MAHGAPSTTLRVMILAAPIGGGELMVILVIVLLLFGGSQLPKLARSLGQAQKEFKKGVETEEAEDGPTA